MKPSEINKLLKEYNIKIYSYKKIDDYYMVDTTIGKLLVNINTNNNYIYEYLNTRKFNFFPEIVINDKYLITKYVEDKQIPREQKINDLIDLVSLLHIKTSYYKNVSDEYLTIYEYLVEKYNYLFDYYQTLITTIDNSIFLSPSQYLLARNITLILDSLNIGKSYLEEWKEKIENLDKMRVCVINNDLSLSNYKRDDKPYIINWNKSKIDMPVYDLYNFINNEDLNISEVLKNYEKKYPLKNIEKVLLLILLFIPNEIELNDPEYNKCISIKKEINILIQTHKLNREYQKSIHKD